MNRYVPTWLETFESNTPIMILSAGSTHSLFLSSPLAGGLVFGCGSNEDNQLGILDTKNLTLIPTLLEDFLDLQVMDISAGDHHSLILSSQGQVLTFGSDKDGTLKLDRSGAGFKLLESPLIKGSSGIKESDYFHPSSVERTREVTAVSAGETHSLILDRHGQVFSFGSMRASIQLQS
jgi:alpha-tubulin suppressor-like RCC1 family protein